MQLKKTSRKPYEFLTGLNKLLVYFEGRFNCLISILLFGK